MDPFITTNEHYVAFKLTCFVCTNVLLKFVLCIYVNNICILYSIIQTINIIIIDSI